MSRNRNRLREIWYNAKRRCTNPNSTCYANYGGRGITFCEEWLNFDTFKKWAVQNGYAENLTIERLDVNKGYCPSNCTWVTNKQQQRNRTDNHLITVDGETKPLSEWCEIYHKCANTVTKRIRKGMTAKEALLTHTKPNIKDLKGMRFGRLVVIGFAYTNNNSAYWNCVCSCGNKKVVKGSNLTSGACKSCGCMQKERAKARAIGNKSRAVKIRNKITGQIYNSFIECSCAVGIPKATLWRRMKNKNFYLERI